MHFPPAHAEKVTPVVNSRVCRDSRAVPNKRRARSKTCHCGENAFLDRPRCLWCVGGFTKSVLNPSFCRKISKKIHRINFPTGSHKCFQTHKLWTHQVLLDSKEKLFFLAIFGKTLTRPLQHQHRGPHLLMMS